MKLQRSVPSFHYSDIAEGKHFFVGYLGFRVVHEAEMLCVVERDHVRFHLEVNSEYAEQLPPLLRVEVDDVDALWEEFKQRLQHSDFVHHRFENGPEMRPWNAKEFAVHHKNGCLVFQQWVTA